MAAGVSHKPNSVPIAGCPAMSSDHSSLDADCPASLATYPGARAGNPLALLYLVLHRVGFTELPRSPGELVRSYRTVSPLPRPRRGGLLSVALAFTSPRLHVMEHPALRCSDFPLETRSPAVVWPAPTGCRTQNDKVNPYFQELSQ